MAGVVVWSYKNNRNLWSAYEPNVSCELEKLFSTGTQHNVNLGIISSNLNSYEVNFVQMTQTTISSGSVREIRRNIYDLASALGQGVMWEFEGDQQSQWVTYDLETNDVIEEGYSKRNQLNTNILDLQQSRLCLPYIIDFGTMTQMRVETGRMRRIQRRQLNQAFSPALSQTFGASSAMMSSSSSSSSSSSMFPGSQGQTNRQSQQPALKMQASKSKKRHQPYTINKPGAVSATNGVLQSPQQTLQQQLSQIPQQTFQQLQQLQSQVQQQTFQHLQQQQSQVSQQTYQQLQQQQSQVPQQTFQQLQQQHSQIPHQTLQQLQQQQSQLPHQSFHQLQQQQSQVPQQTFQQLQQQQSQVPQQTFQQQQQSQVPQQTFLQQQQSQVPHQTLQQQPSQNPGPLTRKQFQQTTGSISSAPALHQHPQIQHSTMQQMYQNSQQLYQQALQNLHITGSYQPMYGHIPGLPAGYQYPSVSLPQLYSGTSMNVVPPPLAHQQTSRSTASSSSSGSSTNSQVSESLPSVFKISIGKSKKTKCKTGVGQTGVEALDNYMRSINTDLDKNDCSICFDKLSEASSYGEGHPAAHEAVELNKCGHQFHRLCLLEMYNSNHKDSSLQCPSCKTIYGEKTGTCPPGYMQWRSVQDLPLPGYEGFGTIIVSYHISPGVQGPEHLKPGQRFSARGFPRYGYLPDCDKGRKVLKLLMEAFRRRLMFTIATSTTTGEENTVTWNEIHHKTEPHGNSTGHGYPDPQYLDNVLMELASHGVTEDCLR